jgi:signal transduction histidine kinase
VKLRGRFTLALALAALVPIGVAAVVTTRVIANSYHDDYETTRDNARVKLQNAREAARDQVRNVTEALATHDDNFVANILRMLVKSGGTLDQPSRKIIRETEYRALRAAALDTLIVTGADGLVLASPHNRSLPNTAMPIVEQRARQTGGEPYFTREKIINASAADPGAPAIETVLVVESARESQHDQGYFVWLQGGMRVTDALLASARASGRFEVDARLVTVKGDVLIPPKGKNWDQLAKRAPIQVPLVDADDKPIAYLEAAVSDGDVDALVWDVTVKAALVALGALGIVVVIGLFVARRTARDLDRLVEGSLHAARGDLDHRVPVRSNDEVGAVANAFNLMMEDLKTSKEKLVIAERIAAWQEIARRLAHEIKNPLTPIQMAMDTLKKSWKKQHPDFGEIVEESTTTVLEEADRLKHIVTEFSDFARMPKPELVRVDLNEVVRGSLALYQGAVPVSAELDDRAPQLDADKGQLNQMLLNLVENARDAIGARDGGRIVVQTKLAGDRAQLVVEDNGPGVPSDLKDKVFAPYFTTKHAKGGTGLGLAIVHRIVNDHGGRITIVDAPGGGARFTIELPLRDGAALLASRI